MEVVKSGTSVLFTITPGAGGYPASADSIALSLVSEAGEVFWQAASDLSWAEATVGGVLLPADAVTTTEIRTYVLVRMVFKDSSGDTLSTLYSPLIIESTVLLRVGENSLGTWGEITLAAMSMVELDAFRAAAESDQITALMNAYQNIGRLGVAFGKTTPRDTFIAQNRIDPNEWGYDTWNQFDAIHSTLQLTPTLLGLLGPAIKTQLIQAQIVEADDLLGGDPVEKMRRSGLLSHSAGESTHFYRPARPLDMPVSKRTAKALKGIIHYAFHLSR